MKWYQQIKCDRPVEVRIGGTDRYFVKCGKKMCRQCGKEWEMHWIGRALAEAQVGTKVRFVTLTYGGGYDNLKAYGLSYKDVQLFLKSLRKAGYKFKQMNVGEFGEKHKRAHWHLLLFFEGQAPDEKGDVVLQEPRVDKERHNQKFWDHGFSVWELPRSKQASVVYLFKYIGKDVAKGAGVLRMSQDVGGRYLERYAREKARNFETWQGHKFSWTIPGNGRRDGKRFEYRIRGQSPLARRMAIAYMEEFDRVHGSRGFDHGEPVHKEVEKIVNGNVWYPQIAGFLENYRLPKRFRPSSYIDEGYKEVSAWDDLAGEARRAAIKEKVKMWFEQAQLREDHEQEREAIQDEDVFNVRIQR